MPSFSRHIPVTNFPPGYSWYKKLWSNIVYWLSSIPLSFRRNLLSWIDIREMKKTIESGDIILSGDFRQASRLCIPGVVTHAIAYLGKGRCIHVDAHGVSFLSLWKIGRNYDTVIILRPYWESKKQLSRYRDILLSKWGKPYDFFFWVKEPYEEVYFCTELINNALREAGYDTLLESVRGPKNILDQTLDGLFHGQRVLLPEEMLGWHFNIVFHSHNIGHENGAYSLQETVSSHA